jgi:hypothetical protein
MGMEVFHVALEMVRIVPGNDPQTAGMALAQGLENVQKMLGVQPVLVRNLG